LHGELVHRCEAVVLQLVIVFRKTSAERRGLLGANRAAALSFLDGEEEIHGDVICVELGEQFGVVGVAGDGDAVLGIGREVVGVDVGNIGGVRLFTVGRLIGGMVVPAVGHQEFLFVRIGAGAGHEVRVAIGI